MGAPWALVALVALVATAVATGGVAVTTDLLAPAGPLGTGVQVWLDVVGLAWALAGAVVVRSRPGHPLGWIVLAVGALTQASLAEEALRRAGLVPETTAAHLLSFLVGTGIFLMLGLLPLLYPSGRLPSRRWRPLVGLIAVGAVAQMAQWLLSELAGWRWPFDSSGTNPGLVTWLPFLVYAGGTVVGWVLCVARIVRAGSPERQQLVLLLVAVALPLVVGAVAGDSEGGTWAMAVALMLLPAGIAVGILRYRMFGIELVLRRGLVYGGLTAAVLGVYAGAAWVGGVALGNERVPAVVAAGLVAVGLLPLRAGLQRWVDLLVYGRRGDPGAALSEIGSAVVGAEPGALADQLVAGVREAVRARGARVLGPDGLVVASSGLGDVEEGTVGVPLEVGGEKVGLLEVAPRAPGERYDRRDVQLLHALGPQVAVAVHAVRLAAELERERDRAVSVRTDERDRLRRDLHDGLGPSLTGMALGLRAVDDALDEADEERARQIVGVVRAEIDRAVTEVRSILDELRPAEVEQQGLTVALRRALDDRVGPPLVEVRASSVTDRLPPVVADTAYRVALEAVANARRHARASKVEVRTAVEEGHLVLEVADDGAGMPQLPADGVGVPSMRSRAAAVGGRLELRHGDGDGSIPTFPGTTVRLVVPLGQEALG